MLTPPPATTVLLRQQQPRAGRAAAYTGLALATIAVFIVAMLVARGLLSGGNSEVNTPDVVGESVQSATEILAGKGLKVGEVTEEYSTKVAQGLVIRQDPAADILFKKGDSVNLVVSKGVHLVLVPSDLVGLSQADARRALKAVGLKVAQIVPRNSEQPPGQVLDTNPAAGSEVAIDSGVTLIVSNGQVKVPDVVGEKVAQARDDLSQAGFQVSLDPPNSPDDAKVISQNPAPGSFVAYGSTVTLRTNAPSPTPTPTPTETPSGTPSPTPTVTPSTTPTPQPRPRP